MTKLMEEIETKMMDAYSAIFGVQGFTEKLFKNFQPRSTAVVAEIGCGSGKLGIKYAMHGCNVFLMDHDPKRLEYAISLITLIENLTGHRMNVCVRKADVFEIPFGDNTFDLIFSEGLHEHFEGVGRQAAFDEVTRVCKGKVIVIVPNALNPKVMQIAKEVYPNQEEWRYEYMPKLEIPFTPEELTEKMRTAGLKNLKVEGIENLPIEQTRMILGVGEK